MNTKKQFQILAYTLAQVGIELDEAVEMLEEQYSRYDAEHAEAEEDEDEDGDNDDDSYDDDDDIEAIEAEETPIKDLDII